MKKQISKILLVLALLPFQVLGQQNIMVCKDIQNVFTDEEGGLIPQRQGPPGKRGAPGVQGPPGLPGIQGPAGIPGAVDYERISALIDEKIRQSSYCNVGAAYGSKIPDSSFSASSEYDHKHAARLARLNTPASGHYGAWCPKISRIGEWIQVDLGKETTVVGMMIQGRPSYDAWVTSFHVGCGLTTSSMRTISDESGTVQVFSGNSDRNAVITHFFRSQQCRYLRIYPLAWNQYSCMRMDFMERC